MKKDKYELEILLESSTFKEASQLVDDKLDIQASSEDLERFNYIFKLKIKIKKEKLNNKFYNSVKDSKKITLLKDESSLERGEEILRRTAEIEIKLRNLVIYISNVIEDLPRLILQEGKFISKKEIKNRESLNPKVSLLTLGELKGFLNFDLSWQGDYPVKITDLLDLICEVDDLAELKLKINEKTESRTIWSMISEFLLEEEINFSIIAGEINYVKSKRDDAAHFKIITPKDFKKFNKKADHIINKIKIQENIDRDKLSNLNEALQNFASNYKKILESTRMQHEMISSVIEINENNSKFLENFLKYYNLNNKNDEDDS